MKINYPTLAVLSVLVLFAGLILTQPTLALAQEKASSVQGELTKVIPPLRLCRSRPQKGKWNFDIMSKHKSLYSQGFQGRPIPETKHPKWMPINKCLPYRVLGTTQW
jgi:hypothetical protein